MIDPEIFYLQQMRKLNSILCTLSLTLFKIVSYYSPGKKMQFWRAEAPSPRAQGKGSVYGLRGVNDFCCVCQAEQSCLKTPHTCFGGPCPAPLDLQPPPRRAKEKTSCFSCKSQFPQRHSLGEEKRKTHFTHFGCRSKVQGCGAGGGWMC